MYVSQMTTDTFCLSPSNPVLSMLMTFFWMGNTISIISETGTACPSRAHEFIHVFSFMYIYIVCCGSLFVFMYNIQILIDKHTNSKCHVYSTATLSYLTSFLIPLCWRVSCQKRMSLHWLDRMLTYIVKWCN